VWPRLRPTQGAYTEGLLSAPDTRSSWNVTAAVSLRVEEAIRVPTNEGNSTSVQRTLERIPLSIRMLFYGVSFLAVVLVGLPWLAYRIDVYLPRWHIEIGVLRIVGVVLFAAFLSMYMFCSYVLTSRGRGSFVEFDPPREFVAWGPYR